MKRRKTNWLIGFTMVLMVVLGAGCGSSKIESGSEDVTAQTSIAATTVTTTKLETTVTVTATASPTPVPPVVASERKGPELTMIGRASVKIVLMDGRVIYIDPYAGDKEDYADQADLVLVTHPHSDHISVSNVTLKADGEVIICPKHMKEGESKTSHGIDILAVPAYNKNHPREYGCGYVLTLDDVVLYHSGDTSDIDEMDALKDLNLDWALLCVDDYYNMGPVEAMKVAERIGAVHVIPIHSDASTEYSQKNVDAFTASSKVELKPGETLTLEK